jgi:hypothetical protein
MHGFPSMPSASTSQVQPNQTRGVPTGFRPTARQCAELRRYLTQALAIYPFADPSMRGAAAEILQLVMPEFLADSPDAIELRALVFAAAQGKQPSNPTEPEPTA